MATVSSRKLYLDSNTNGLQLTPDEFDAADFEPGWRYDLVNGVLIVNPPPLNSERDPNEELGYMLRSYKDEHPNGHYLDYTISEQTVRIGPIRRRVDRAIWVGLGRLPDEYETPTITIEFVSKSKANRLRDYEIKRDEYRTAGVREYWIIDRFAHTLTLYRFGGGRSSKKVYKPGQTLETSLLPGFKVPLAKLFMLADRWDK